MARHYAEETDEMPVVQKSIAPSTPVSMSVRTFISMIVGLVALLFGVGTTYFALASTDRDLGSKQSVLERRFDEAKENAVTKADLRALRLDVREDLLNAVWLCEPGGSGAMKCRPSLREAR